MVVSKRILFSNSDSEIMTAWERVLRKKLHCVSRRLPLHLFTLRVFAQLFFGII